jgi:hypothetical protein
VSGVGQNLQYPSVALHGMNTEHVITSPLTPPMRVYSTQSIQPRIEGSDYCAICNFKLLLVDARSTQIQNVVMQGCDQMRWELHRRYAVCLFRSNRVVKGFIIFGGGWASPARGASAKQSATRRLCKCNIAGLQGSIGRYFRDTDAIDTLSTFCSDQNIN